MALIVDLAPALITGLAQAFMVPPVIPPEMPSMPVDNTNIPAATPHFAGSPSLAPSTISVVDAILPAGVYFPSTADSIPV